jgi:DNA repair ATPase RecN
MNKLLNNLENKLKDVEQDIKSLQALNSCENDVCDSIDFKEEQKEDIENDIFQVKQLKRDLENDKTITDVLQTLESFKENLSFTFDNRLK